jgi:hypothetical protein
LFYLLFTLYLVIFCWVISRVKFFKESSLDKRILIALFLARVLVGLINGYINVYYYNILTDSANFQNQGITEYHLLFQNPQEYFINIFQSNRTNSYSGFLESTGSFWNDTRSNLVVKMLSIFDIFSGTNFFINTLFYNFLIFFGTVAIYKVFIKIFPTHKYVLIVIIFLLPSVIYFSSAVHRDGLIFLSLSMIIYHLFFLMKIGLFAFKRIFLCLVFLCLILLLRNFVFIALVPALLAWIVAEKKPNHPFVIFLGTYALIAVLFFATSFLPPSMNLPAHVSSRQLDFIKIAKLGSSAVNINPLYPGFRSFLNNIPQALNHTLMRPYLSEHQNFFYIPAGLEILFYEILFLFFIFFRQKIPIIPPIVYFSLFFSFTMFLIIGYTIPIVGAIARYRSIYFPFLLIPIVCYTDWQKIKEIFIFK